MVAHQFHIVFYVLRRVAAWLTKDRVHRVPCQQRTVLVVVYRVAQGMLGEAVHVWCRSQTPITWIVYVDICLRCFEVIYIGGTHLSYFFRMTGYQVGELGIDLEGRRCSSIDPRHFVYQQCQPLHFRFPMGIHTPYRVCQRLATRIHFGRQWSLVHVHNRTADGQVFIELIFQVCAKQRLTLHREQCLILQLHIHIRSRLQDGLVQYRHSSHGVVHRVIHILHKGRTACCHNHTSARHIHRIQSYLIACRTLVFTHQGKLILLRVFLCAHKGRVVQLLEHIFLCHACIAYLACQVTTEGLQHGEDYPTRRRQCRIAFHIVKASIGRGVVARVQTVKTHHANQLLAFDISFHEVLHVCTHRVVAVLDIQLKLIATHLTCANRVNVLHHQVPSTFVFHIGCIIAALQHLQQQGVRCFQRLARIR